jgi:hypothetical protein
MASPSVRLMLIGCVALVAASAATPNPASAALLAVGHGYGASPELARAAAHADLALRLQRRAATYFDGVSGTTAASVKRAIAGGRELPLIGIEFANSGASGAVRFEARLTDASLAAYERETRRIAERLRRVDPGRITAVQFADAFAQFDQYLRINAVLALFSSTVRRELDLEAPLWSNAANNLSPAAGAKDVAQRVKLELGRANITQCSIIAPVTADTAEVTTFSASIADELLGAVGSAARDERATCTLDGRYRQFDGRVVLTLFLLDASFNTQRAFVFVLRGAADQGSVLRPRASDLAATLSRGLVRVELAGEGTSGASVGKAMEVDVRMGRGSRGLYYRPGERDKLLVKLHRPGYYYIVCHVQKEAERFSYLMEIGEQGSRERFVRQVAADQVSRWQTVVEFTVEAPLGLEAVQVFATSAPPQKMVPATRFDPRRNLHLVGTDPVDAIRRTRGLVLLNIPDPRKEPGGKTNPAPLAVGEAVLQFSTLP